MGLSFFDQFFHSAPPDVDVDAIWQEWLALKPPYDVAARHIPLPVWARRPYTESGAQAWETLQSDLRRIPAHKPLCLYWHIPFCGSKCGFCDSYSFKLGQHQTEYIDDYVELLLQEMHSWNAQGELRHRPVSTVHLGGGTPTYLGERALRRLIETCASLFTVSPHTEWALESTVADLPTTMLSCLHSLGFRRLHIGVQSLEDPVRQNIGRRRSAAEVMAKIVEAIDRGWIVSVDLICGLPGETLTGFLNGIKALWQSGVHGVSLYELLIYPRNHRWAAQWSLTERDHLANYCMFQAGAHYLSDLGFKKNIFNHFASERDQNRYFTFPARAEDLLALGSIADGVFGDYHYRHPIYKQYRQSANRNFPGLEGGLRRNAVENYLHPIETALLAGRIPAALSPALEIGLPNTDDTLLNKWLALALLEYNAAEETFQLTANGSWFAGNMLTELIGLVKK
jgi:coproporphyrinogen III oxidase-like Fe-S oxidoreductase